MGGTSLCGQTESPWAEPAFFTAQTHQASLSPSIMASYSYIQVFFRRRTTRHGAYHRYTRFTIHPNEALIVYSSVMQPSRRSVHCHQGHVQLCSSAFETHTKPRRGVPYTYQGSNAGTKEARASMRAFYHPRCPLYTETRARFRYPELLSRQNARCDDVYHF